jgi:biotin synthase-like enzyme
LSTDLYDNQPKVLYGNYPEASTKSEVEDMVSYIKDDFNLKYYSTSGSTLDEHIEDYDKANFEYE